jgi:hypothetical protein
VSKEPVLYVRIYTQELGWCAAHYHQESSEADFLIIFSPSSITEMIASPASDVRISGTRNIEKLRDFLNQVLPPKK